MSRLFKIVSVIIVLPVFALAVLLVPHKALAQGVKLSAEIREHRPTDTVNDFAFETINPYGSGKMYL